MNEVTVEVSRQREHRSMRTHWDGSISKFWHPEKWCSVWCFGVHESDAHRAPMAPDTHTGSRTGMALRTDWDCSGCWHSSHSLLPSPTRITQLSICSRWMPVSTSIARAMKFKIEAAYALCCRGLLTLHPAFWVKKLSKPSSLCEWSAGCEELRRLTFCDWGETWRKEVLGRFWSVWESQGGGARRSGNCTLEQKTRCHACAVGLKRAICISTKVHDVITFLHCLPALKSWLRCVLFRDTRSNFACCPAVMNTSGWLFSAAW